MRLVAIVFLAGALSLASAASAAPKRGDPAPSKRARALHPDTGGVEDCRGCHASATPAAFEAWSRGKHGEVLVTCVVCHGSTGRDFAPRPAADRCGGCHPEQAASTSPGGGKAKAGCFDCHPAHALDPHGTRRTATARTKDVTRTELSTIAYPDVGIQSVPLTIQPAPPPAPPGGATPAPQASPSAPPSAPAQPGR